MEEMQLGPNGALLFCIEYLIQNQEWLREQLDGVLRQDDYAIFDCPGQIELFSDQSIFREVVKILQEYGTVFGSLGFSLVSMYMIDVSFISDNHKFASGILQYI
jgi:GTPase SAR1 family protein